MAGAYTQADGAIQPAIHRSNCYWECIANCDDLDYYCSVNCNCFCKGGPPRCQYQYRSRLQPLTSAEQLAESVSLGAVCHADIIENTIRPRGCDQGVSPLPGHQDSAVLTV
jgi:hypothetical protein